MNIKLLRQKKADNDAAQAKLKKEGRDLLAVADRAPEQSARLDAIDGQLNALATEAEQITRDLARAERFAEDERAQGSLQGDRIEAGLDRATLRPWGPQVAENAPQRVKDRATTIGFGEFLAAVAEAGRPGGTVDARLMAGQAAPSGASTGTPSDGGYLVRKDWSTALLDKAQEQAVLLPRTFEVPISADSDGLEAPYVDETSRATGSRWGGVRVYRRSEAETVTAAKPKLGKLDLRLEDMMGLMYTTNRQLRDAGALGVIATRAFASEFSFKIDDEIIRGTGAGQALGILNAPCLVTQAAEGGQTADTVNATNIQKMFARMPARLLGGSAWYINNEVWPQLFAMTQANNAIFLPGGSLANAPYGTLLGRPIVPIEQASAIGDVGDIVFANFGEYVTITKGGIEFAESMHVRFIYDEMTYRWIYRINGQPAWSSALTPYKGASTLSPFVALAAR